MAKQCAFFKSTKVQAERYFVNLMIYVNKVRRVYDAERKKIVKHVGMCQSFLIKVAIENHRPKSFIITVFVWSTNATLQRIRFISYSTLFQDNMNPGIIILYYLSFRSPMSLFSIWLVHFSSMCYCTNDVVSHFIIYESFN